MNYEQRLALLSLVQLNTILVQQGLVPLEDKKAAKTAVRALIDNGTVDWDSALNVKPQAVVTGKVDNDLRDKVNESNAKAIDAVKNTEIALREIARLSSDVRTNTAAIRDEFKTLADSLVSRVDSITKPDPARISNEITQQVTALFDSFREQVTPVQLKQVANALPTFELQRAADVFGVNACRYGFDVDFGDLQVAVWNDADAPALVDDYIFNPEHLHQALIALDDPLPDNVWLAGERGTGKSEFVAQVAARLKRRLFRVNFDEALERADFIGGNSIEAGSVVWKAGIITQAIRHPGSIVLLDEIGFARAQSLAALHALCERSPHRSIVIAETGERIPVASHVVFFCADNSNGHGDTSGNFAGVREQNSAFLDRFSYTLYFEYLPEDDEVSLIVNRTGVTLDAARIIVKFANVAREKARAGLLTQPPSLRQLFAWARSVKKGLPVNTAFKNAIINKFPEDCRVELLGVYTSHINESEFKLALTK
jgi:MoxR-like ATPase